MGASSSAPLVDLTDKERKKCVEIPVVSPPHVALSKIRKLGVEVVAAEFVMHVRPEDEDGDAKNEKKHKRKKEGNPPPDTSQVSAEQGGECQKEEQMVSRVPRAIFLTKGTLHIEVKKRFRKGKDPIEKYPNVLFALRDLHAVRHAAGSDLVVLAAWDANGDVDYAMYQTPDPGRLLQPLSETLVAAHASVPRWAVPVRWNVGVDLPRVSDQATFLGADGGFSTSFFASAIATLVRSNVAIGPLSQGPPHIAATISQQQPPSPFVPRNGPQCLDVSKLVRTLPGSSPESLTLGALSCLPFNLIFRKLLLNDFTFRDEAMMALFGKDMARVLLYNVTLREIDLSGTTLRGLGEDLGQALAMNIQPLISRLNLSGCRLSDRDLRGLVPGLARVWCGGSAWPESIAFTDNPDVSPASWTTLFDALVNPGTLPFWPASPPPPPILAFLQSIDIRGTSAAGPGFARLLPRLSGLRSIGIGSRRGPAAGGGRQEGMDVVLQSLAELDAPLESFVGEGMDGSCATTLFCHCKTLRSVTFVDFCGDAALLLGSWPEPMPNLTLEFKGKCHDDSVIVTDVNGYAPLSLVVRDRNFGRHAMKVLSTRATGLKSLHTYEMHYTEISDAVQLLAFSGLTTLHINRSAGSQLSPVADWRASFWNALAPSKTLEDLQVPNQLSNNSGELAMVGGFLKKNRSVRWINFDGSDFSLDVEGVMALRSAFYGNKKVIHMKYLREAHERTVRESKATTEALLREVQDCKSQIKRIFKSHYSKYNPNWRAKPNQLKLPYVERIRQAKRKIGKIERDMAKIARLLNEIRQCVEANRMGHDQIQREKEQVKVERREGQLASIAQKKQKIMTTIVQKLHKAKQRGRQGKSGKKQIPRSAYYKDKNLWPGRNVGKRGAPSSHYRSWNDPYNARYHWGYGYYSPAYYGYRHNYLDDCDADLNTFPPIEEHLLPPHSDEDSHSENGSEGEGADDGVEVVHDQGPVAEQATGGEMPAPPPCIVDNDVSLDAFPDGGTFSEDNEWELIAPESDPIDSMVPADPWDAMDCLVQSADGNVATALSPAFLAEVHMEAAELGPDVVADLAPVLDAGAAVDAKIDSMADSMAVDRDLLSAVVDSSVDQNFDLGAIQGELGEVDDYMPEADEEAAAAADEADDAVEMYAGAGPRDLDDGGPSFGDSGSAALAGARRRARTRKVNRTQRRIRSSLNSRSSIAYRALSFPSSSGCGFGMDSTFPLWPDDPGGMLMQDVTAVQIDAMSKSDLFPLPDVANDKTERIFEWSQSCNSNLVVLEAPIEVVLITQCSIDRLPNLQAQLVAWKGKASVAVYVKHSTNIIDARRAIVSHIHEAKGCALASIGGAPHWDIALTVVQESSDDASYPINFLRNSALLEARYQQLKRGDATDRSVALLVDVDFRPSENLFRELHCKAAADTILDQQRVVVCPAFECATHTTEGASSPRTISELRHCVDNGQAEGFHLSHFARGHGPTRFDEFWARSLGAGSDDLWKHVYDVPYEKCFEPYVAMALDSVPLYDERFQGYGLNKVSHVASIAQTQTNNGRDFLVLPGVFLVAPAHERSESWSQIYGSTSDEAKFNKLWLKGLYRNFCSRLEEGEGPIVSSRTMKLDSYVVSNAKKLTRKAEGEAKTQGKMQLAASDPLLVLSKEEQWSALVHVTVA